jgi:hypothetical protein
MIFFNKFLKNAQTIFMRIGIIEAELFRADRWTDRMIYRCDETNNRFSKLCERA